MTSHQAIVLRADPWKDQDKLLLVLTAEYGLISVFANGVRKPKAHLHSAAQPFCYGEFSFYHHKKSDSYTLQSATLQGLFFEGLTKELSRLELAARFVQLYQSFAPRQEPAQPQLRLLLNALFFLSKGTRSVPLLDLIVTFRLICLAGYTPDLTGSGSYFSPDKGALSPGSALSSGVRLSPCALETLRFLSVAPLEQLFRLNLPPEELASLLNCVTAYANLKK